METAAVGKVVVSAKIENVVDLYAASKGQIPDDQVRRIEVSDAMVDTGATYLGMPKQLIEQLGIPQFASGRARTTAGYRTFGVYGPVRLTIQGRSCSVDVWEIADDCPVLVVIYPWKFSTSSLIPRATA